MGDADVGTGGGASSLDSGDAGSLAASRALMEGGSLPPRKRLLAGLKQNGWLSTSPPPVVSPSAIGHAGGVGAQAVGVESVVRSGSAKYEDGCMGCNAVESNGLRRIKRGGVSLRLCSACTLLYSKSMFCPHCLAMYHDASLLGDPSMWLVCSRCRRSVHPECEQKHSGSTPDPASYVCLDCVNSARRQREANGVTGMRSKHSSARPCDWHGSFELKFPHHHRGRPSGMVLDESQLRAEPVVEQSCWANMPPELLRDVIQRVEASESAWPSRKHVVACAAVCSSWREITKELVRTPEQSGRLTFPIALKQVRVEERDVMRMWGVDSGIGEV
ncbi:hypothetical protein M758_8G002300 [Ceratodon purpureus]|nr:hypothetical protein M758_8G002300 [Ceratodon purpureus]